MRLSKAFASLLLGGAFAVQVAQAAAPADAPARLRVCKPCDLPNLPLALPRHGMLLFRCSFFNANSLWYTVDLERGEASRMVTHNDSVAHKIDLVERTTHRIPPGDLAVLKEISTRIWASADAFPTRMATDVAWELWQLDGDDARHDGGPGLPGALAEEAQEIIQRLVRKPASSE